MESGGEVVWAAGGSLAWERKEGHKCLDVSVYYLQSPQVDRKLGN